MGQLRSRFWVRKGSFTGGLRLWLRPLDADSPGPSWLKLRFWRLLEELKGVPGGTGSNEPTCHCRRSKRHGFDPWVRKIPWRRAWQPTPVFLPGESHGQRSLAGCSPWGRTESDTAEATEHAPTWGKWGCPRRRGREGRSLGFCWWFD